MNEPVNVQLRSVATWHALPDSAMPRVPETDLGCRVLAGDLDYVANPRVIRECYDDGWDAWARRVSTILDRAESAGAAGVSLYARSRRLGEADLLERVAALAARRPQQQCLLHFLDAETPSRIARASRVLPTLNHVSGESWVLAQLSSTFGEQPFPVVVQPIGDAGIPQTVAGRMQIIERVAHVLDGLGVPREQIHVDALSPAHGVLPYPLRVSLDLICAAKRAGFSTILWPANAGLGHPRRDVIAATYAALAVQAGLDWAVVALSDRPLLAAIAAANQLNGRSNGYDELQA